MSVALKDLKENLELKFICDQIESYPNFVQEAKRIENEIFLKTDRGTALFNVFPAEKFPEQLKQHKDVYSKFYEYRLRAKIYLDEESDVACDGIETFVIQVSVKPNSDTITVYCYDFNTGNWPKIDHYALVTSNVGYLDRLRLIPKTTLADESRGYKPFVPKKMDNTNNNSAAGVYHQMPAVAQPSLNQLADAGNVAANNPVAAPTADANNGAAKLAAK